MRAPIIGAFAFTVLAAVFALAVGVLVTAGVSSGMSARAAGDALMWMGAAQLAMTAFSVVAFGWLARRWSGATPPWWSQLLLGVLLLCAAAMLFLVAMVLMNR